MFLLLRREDAGNSFIAEGVTQGWRAVKAQLMEGVVWDECFLLHTKIQCQVL